MERLNRLDGVRSDKRKEIEQKQSKIVRPFVNTLTERRLIAVQARHRVRIVR